MSRGEKILKLALQSLTDETNKPETSLQSEPVTVNNTPGTFQNFSVSYNENYNFDESFDDKNEGDSSVCYLEESCLEVPSSIWVTPIVIVSDSCDQLKDNETMLTSESNLEHNCLDLSSGRIASLETVCNYDTDLTITNEPNESVPSNSCNEDSDFILEDFETSELPSSDITSLSENSLEEVNKNDNISKVRLVSYSDSDDSGNMTQEVTSKRKRRKRHEVDENTWQYRKHQQNREQGLPYKGRTKVNGHWKYDVQKEKRCLKARCNCCNMQKTTKIKCGLITDSDREKIFKLFWNLSWEEKRMYSNMLITLKPTKRIRDRKEEGKSKRKHSIEYYLKKSHDRIRVCKKMFLGTLGVGQWTVLHWKNTEGNLENLVNCNIAEEEEFEDENLYALENQVKTKPNNIKYKLRQKPFR